MILLFDNLNVKYFIFSIYISPKKKSNIKLFVKNSSGKIRIEDQTITPKNNSSNKKSEKMEIENQQITPKKVRYTRSTANQNEPDYVKQITEKYDKKLKELKSNYSINTKNMIITSQNLTKEEIENKVFKAGEEYEKKGKQLKKDRQNEIELMQKKYQNKRNNDFII